MPKTAYIHVTRNQLKSGIFEIVCICAVLCLFVFMCYVFLMEMQTASWMKWKAKTHNCFTNGSDIDKLTDCLFSVPLPKGYPKILCAFDTVALCIAYGSANGQVSAEVKQSCMNDAERELSLGECEMHRRDEELKMAYRKEMEKKLKALNDSTVFESSGSKFSVASAVWALLCVQVFNFADY
ncbi:uncharacterized protein LOC142336919 [Convolutriloba macropyga]|uniref:uncharacterized protein LOC142336919 n=1 Tax=Convolutriloba macropyga TaxID=536237 RepID=UPI003F5250DB